MLISHTLGLAKYFGGVSNLWHRISSTHELTLETNLKLDLTYLSSSNESYEW